VSLLRFLSIAMLAVWIGGLVALGAVAAPAVFATLEAQDPAGGRTLGGLVFGQIFQRFQIVSVILGLLLAVTLALRTSLGARPRRLGLRLSTVAGMILVSLGTSMLVAPRIDTLRRETAGAIASLDDRDPRKIEFGRLHGLSNGLMVLDVIAGFGLLWLEATD
jgi:hypothetical protein